MFKLLFLASLFFLTACGVKSAPLPPFTPEEAAKEEELAKAREEKHKKQLEAIQKRRKLDEEANRPSKEINGN